MVPSGRFALALASCVAIVIAATVGAISLTSGRDALQLDELLLHEPIPEDLHGSLDEQLVWVFEIFGGQRRWTETGLNDRFTPGFSDGFDAATLNAGLDRLFADFGRVQFHRLTDHDADTVRVLGVADNGAPIAIWFSVADTGQIESLTLDEVPSPPRLPPWQATLVVLASWSFVAAALAASRYRDMAQAWLLLVDASIVASTVLLLSDSRAAYTAGRVVPAMALPVTIWLLARPLPRRAIGALVAAGAAAAGLAALATLTRDADLIAHPALYGSIADSETVYRSVLVASFALSGATFGVVALLTLAPLRRAIRGNRSYPWSVVGLTAIWAMAGIVSSIDYAVGSGSWAHGAMAVVTSTLLILVPAVAVLGIIAARWHHPWIERLVIDLEADNAQLDRAVAAALEDPAVDILVSPDGRRLETQAGLGIDPQELALSRSVTEIRSGERLVGALVHDSALRHEPERLEAVAAAAGMAPQVERPNRQVTAQLEEVNASQPRIGQASDTARR
ncbi:MAG: hypothetical protein GY708_18445, partial [Actinomycetia bacterium]|nr:hypothetical protein [Actinomycetes bacterium]